MESYMKLTYLIAPAALLLPAAIAMAQDAAPQAGSAPAAESSPAAAEAAPAASAGASGGAAVQAAPATDADLTKGAVVNDPAGKPVGTIDSTTAEGVVLAVGEKRFQIPKASIGKTGSGLVTTVTREWLESAADKQKAAS